MKFVISMASYNIGQVQHSATCMTNYILETIIEYHKRYTNSNGQKYETVLIPTLKENEVILGKKLTIWFSCCGS
jgi:hypothetical protein